MGVRGRGALNRFLFGSTTEHVVRDPGCPVLTLHVQVALDGSERVASADTVANGQIGFFPVFRRMAQIDT